MFSPFIISINGDFDLDCTVAGNNIPLNNISGIGNSRTFTAGLTIYSGDTCNIDYTGSGIEDTAGNSLAVFSNKAVTNNSTQQAPEEPEPAEDEIHHSGISIFGRSVQ